MEKLRNDKRYLIAGYAEKALKDEGYETRPGWCQRWVKQVLLKAGVSPEMATEGARSAKDAFSRHKENGMVMPKGTRLNIGDILYKVSVGNGKFGHVGIYIGNDTVAENSSYHVNGARTDARGTRSVKSFGACQVVRLWQ